ncbi:MAG: hypothetical protein LBK22_00380, partial [Tannerella sp.]|nr:hypothetical protein [Tannerella sp.]
MRLLKLKFKLLILLCFIFSAAVSAQDDDEKNQFSPLNTAVPSLSIAPDARGGGMGDNGAAT